MLIFDEKTHKVKHELLEDKEEAGAFIDFLEAEGLRHVKESLYSGGRVEWYEKGLSSYTKAMVELWQSQVLRHGEDIESINASIKAVKERLNL